MKTRFATHVLIIAAVSTAATLAPLEARADCDCTYTQSQVDKLADEEAFWGNIWIPAAPSGAFAWFINQYELQEKDWDGGFGWNDPYNVDLALARTINALTANLFSADNEWRNLSPHDWIEYGRRLFFWSTAYVQKADHLDAACYPNCDPTSSVLGQAQGNKVTLFRNFFYNVHVWGRVGTLVHEARHVDGYSHDGTSCNSCDSSWSYHGANRKEAVHYFFHFRHGYRTTLPRREYLADRYYAILDIRFDSPPDYSDWGDLCIDEDSVSTGYDPECQYDYCQNLGTNQQASSRQCTCSGGTDLATSCTCSYSGGRQCDFTL